jgi:hypothetical protein
MPRFSLSVAGGTPLVEPATGRRCKANRAACYQSFEFFTGHGGGCDPAAGELRGVLAFGPFVANAGVFV